MNLSETSLLAIAIGVVIPGLTALLAKLNASAQVKVLLTALLAGIAGGLAGAYAHPPVGLGQWVPILESIASAWGSAIASYFGLWKPTGAAPAVAQATARFGFGRETTPPMQKAA
ncbi:MAG TPA: hypothetical protein VII76_07055 [Acidimicrobiales bacterium]